MYKILCKIKRPRKGLGQKSMPINLLNDSHCSSFSQLSFNYSESKKDNINKLVEKVQNKQIKLGDLTPQEQKKFIKTQIGKKIKQNEISKIRGMTISQVNDVVDQDVDPPMDESRLNRIRLMNLKMGITEDILEHSIKTPGEKHLQMLQKVDMLQKKKWMEYKKDPVMAQIKRGKLGMDNFFIVFSIFGSLMIPLYVFNKFKKNRQEIVASRIATPEVIKRLDEDSPISLQDVNYHTIHYYNPDRVKEDDVKRKIRQDRDKLQRQLYF